jgi:hypothetical protein
LAFDVHGISSMELSNYFHLSDHLY